METGGLENLNSLSDDDIAGLVESTCNSGANISLGIPYVPETVSMFFKMFHCQRCGACCRGGPSPTLSGVLLSPPEVATLAEALDLPRSRFKQDYTHVTDGHRLLNYPCPFNTAEAHACRIYSQRPEVCRTFPLHNPLPTADGTYLLVVAGICPEGRRVATEFFKMRRDLARSLQQAGQAEQEAIKQASQAFWETSRQKQSRSGWFKEMP